MRNNLKRIKESIDHMISTGTSPEYVMQNLEGLFPGLTPQQYAKLRKYIIEKYAEKYTEPPKPQLNVDVEEVFNNALALLQSADIEAYKELKKKLLDMLYYIGWDSDLPEEVKKMARKLYHLLIALFE